MLPRNMAVRSVWFCSWTRHCPSHATDETHKEQHKTGWHVGMHDQHRQLTAGLKNHIMHDMHPLPHAKGLWLNSVWAFSHEIQGELVFETDGQHQLCDTMTHTSWMPCSTANSSLTKKFGIWIVADCSCRLPHHLMQLTILALTSSKMHSQEQPTTMEDPPCGTSCLQNASG